MLALLRTRRWIGFTVVVIVAIVGFGLLSRWQWSRADERRQEKAQLTAESAQAPVPLEQALSPGAPLAPGQEWRPVTARGTYDAAGQVLVRKRPLNSRNGFWVATPLRTDRGVLWVNRGWLPATSESMAVQEAPAPPGGEVEVTGALRPGEQGPAQIPADLPAGQVTDLDPTTLTAAAPSLAGAGTAYDAYLQLAASTPPQSGDLLPVPPPEIDEGRNVSYAVQWILFALVASIGWVYFLRREAREDAAAVRQPAAPA